MAKKGWISVWALQDECLDTAAIQDSAVTEAKIADDAVTIDKLSDAVKVALSVEGAIDRTRIDFCFVA